MHSLKANSKIKSSIDSLNGWGVIRTLNNWLQTLFEKEGYVVRLIENLRHDFIRDFPKGFKKHKIVV